MRKPSDKILWLTSFVFGLGLILGLVIVFSAFGAFGLGRLFVSRAFRFLLGLIGFAFFVLRVRFGKSSHKCVLLLGRQFNA